MMFTPELIFGNALDYFLLYLNILITYCFHRSMLHWCQPLPGRSVSRLRRTTILKSDSTFATPSLLYLYFHNLKYHMICCCATLLSAHICSVLIYLKAGAETTGSSVFLSLLQQIQLTQYTLLQQVRTCIFPLFLHFVYNNKTLR